METTTQNPTRKPLSLRLPKKLETTNHVKIEFEESVNHNMPNLVPENVKQEDTKSESSSQHVTKEPANWKVMWEKY